MTDHVRMRTHYVNPNPEETPMQNTTATTTARPPEQLAADIRAAVAKLKDSWRYVDGVLVTEPSLLTQLYRAIRSSSGGTTVGASSSSERIPLNTAAFQLYLELCDAILAEARAWTHRRDLMAAFPEANLAHWLDAFEAGRQRGEVVRSQEEHALRMLDGWLRSVDDLFDPPIRKEILAACPTCGERYWDDYRAETRTSSLRVEYRPGAGSLEASCRWCLQRWATTRDLITLGEAIGVPFNAAAIAEAMSAAQTEG